MPEDSLINHVVAANLAHWMKEAKLSQQALADKAGVSQKTISNCLNPDQRVTGSKGKEPSVKLTELSQIAGALGVSPWQLLRDMTPAERELYAAVERHVASLREELTGAEARREQQASLQPPAGTVKVIKQHTTPALRKSPHTKR